MTMPRAAARGTGATIRFAQMELQLDKGNHFRLCPGQALHLSAVRGVAWITFERATAEAVISPGESWVVAPGEIAVIGPLRDSVTLELGVAPSASERSASHTLRILSRLRRFLGTQTGNSFAKHR